MQVPQVSPEPETARAKPLLKIEKRSPLCTEAFSLSAPYRDCRASITGGERADDSLTEN